MFDRFIRLMLSADLGDGGGGVTDPSSNDAPAQASAGAPAPSTAPTGAPAPSQPQGPNWDSLGVPFDQAQQRLKYYEDLSNRYQNDPTWAQKFDQLYGGQQQQRQQHPYDWMNGDEKRLEALRQQGEQHPDHIRLQQEFTNFFHNQVGHIKGIINHPEIVSALYEAMAPNLQDLIQRGTQPFQQYIHQQGEQQFRQQYEKPWVALPDSIKQMAQEGVFGDWNNNRQQAIMGAVKAGQRLAQQQAAQPVPGQQPPEKKPGPSSPSKPSTPSGSKKSKAAEEFEKEYAAGLSGKK
jgi:hypothetical protein